MKGEVDTAEEKRPYSSLSIAFLSHPLLSSLYQRSKFKNFPEGEKEKERDRGTFCFRDGHKGRDRRSIHPTRNNHFHNGLAFSPHQRKNAHFLLVFSVCKKEHKKHKKAYTTIDRWVNSTERKQKSKIKKRGEGGRNEIGERESLGL